DVDVAAGIHGHIVRAVELPTPAAEGPPLSDERRSLRSGHHRSKACEPEERRADMEERACLEHGALRSCGQAGRRGLEPWGGPRRRLPGYVPSLQVRM